MVAAGLAVRRPEEVVAGDDREARLRDGLACRNQARDHLVPANVPSRREFRDDSGQTFMKKGAHLLKPFIIPIARTPWLFFSHFRFTLHWADAPEVQIIADDVLGVVVVAPRLVRIAVITKDGAKGAVARPSQKVAAAATVVAAAIAVQVCLHVVHASIHHALQTALQGHTVACPPHGIAVVRGVLVGDVSGTEVA